MSIRRKIVVAPGDGVGPEIMGATLMILEAAKVPLEWEKIELGKSIYEKGNPTGVPSEAWSKIREAGVLLKAPITTPQGKGFNSVNVTIRKTLNLFANVRPCISYAPYVASPHPGINLVIVRENEEDLYAGIEYRQTDETYHAIKMVSRPGTEKIIRYAFEYARAYGRRKVTCMTKDNIMKLSDGLFHRIFEEVAREYPDIESDHYIIDIGAARLAASPEIFDVIVTLNLYGDILSDIAAQLAGSIGLGSSANVGEHYAMFEAVHGSAPDIAGKGIANPSGLLLAATQMLVHLGLSEYAELITNAWLCTLEAGIHTPDIYRESLSTRQVGTSEFARAVINRLGEKPKVLKPVHFNQTQILVKPTSPPRQTKTLIGVDVFLHWDEEKRDAEVLARKIQQVAHPVLPLKIITNRGVKVFPEGIKETFCSDQWRCRFVAEQNPISQKDIIRLLENLTDAGLDIIKTENLYMFDAVPGFSLGQGE